LPFEKIGAFAETHHSQILFLVIRYFGP